MPHVFISYSRNDTELASEIERRLEAMGVRVWIDKQIPTAARWEMEISQAIKVAEAFFIVWTSAAAESEWVNKEIDLALQRVSKGEAIEIVIYKADERVLRADLSIYQHNAGKCLNTYLRDWRSKPVCREFRTLENGRLLLEHEGAEPLGETLARLPFGRSVHAGADLIAGRHWRAGRALAESKLAVFLATTRGTDDAGDVELIRTAWEARCPGMPLVLLRVSGPCQDGRFRMDDSGPNGQWLDVVETLNAGVQALAGSGSATLFFFTKTLTPLALLTGWRLERYWQVELHHFTTGAVPAYRHVASSTELPRHP